MPSNSAAQASLPRHVAIIMDGNGRWARKRGLPRSAGHVAGVESVREVVRTAVHIGLANLTLYAFSTENWKRPLIEVNHLMALFRGYFRKDVRELRDMNVRMRIIGNRARAANDILSMIEEGESLTADNTGLNLAFAFDYGAQEEIVAAARKFAEAVKQGKMEPDSITVESFSQQLQTDGMPDPDFVIRTSGERRISNFLLFQSAYSEFLFIETMWPDFGRAEFLAALEHFAGRERRFGSVATEAVA
ncbi:MAG: isoprenyl transferase [Alphaproteobacteria bacterium]|nr:isoprenyl transferase [Alphaproteobacteria bacterium]